MTTINKICAALIVLVISSIPLFGQSVGDYRSNSTTGGNWGSAVTWQRWNGSAWANAPTPPTGSEFITIQTGDSVYVNVPVSITGTLRNQARLGGADNLTIANGGTLQHDQDNGSLPLATWSQGSTVLLTGSTGTTPTNRNQSFYNVTFNTPGLLANLNMGWDDNIIGGNITVTNTGVSRWQMTAPTSGDTSIITIMGDVIQTDGQFSTNGTSNANTHIIVHQYGNINVTGGNLSVSRGSQGSGTGSTRWILHQGNFSMSNATTQNSNPSNAWFVFAKQGVQTLTLGSGNTITALPIVVNDGTTLDAGVSELAGSGRFILNSGATLATGHAAGISGLLGTVTGTIDLSTSANFTFNGTVAQVTSTMMPTTVNNLVINNAAGVTLSQPTTINGVLRLQAGVFNNTIPFTLGPNGSISFEGGSLLVTSVENQGTIPQTFFVEQNYPNPFNPSTTIRYGLPANSEVSVRVFNLIGQEIATLFAGKQIAGTHSLQFDASNLSSGVYVYRIQAGNNVQSRTMILMK